MRTLLFTSESVSEGHPDKVADQISDAILDEFLKQDPESKVACEVFVTTGLVVIGGEVRSNAWVDIQQIARQVIADIGYTKAEYKFEAESCGIVSTIHEQSSDIIRVWSGKSRRSGSRRPGHDVRLCLYRNRRTYAAAYSFIAYYLNGTGRHSQRRKTDDIPSSLIPNASLPLSTMKQKAQRIDTRFCLQHDPFAGDQEMQQQITRDVPPFYCPAS